MRAIVAFALLGPGGLSCTGGPPSQPRVTPTATAGISEHAPADGETWGGFVFVADRASAAVTPSPPPVQSDESFEGAGISDLPGYRAFETTQALAAFLAGRADVRAPADLPDGAELIDAYAVLLQDGRVAMIGLEYRYAGSDAPAGDADLWVVRDFRTPRPVVIETGKPRGYPDSLGRDAAAPVAVEAAGRQALYLRYDSPTDLGRSLVLRSALSWFGDDGSFWSVQGRRLDLPGLVTIAASLGAVTSP